MISRLILVATLTFYVEACFDSNILGQQTIIKFEECAQPAGKNRVLQPEINFIVNAYFCLQLILLCKSTLQITIVSVLDILDQICGSFL